MYGIRTKYQKRAKPCPVLVHRNSATSELYLWRGWSFICILPNKTSSRATTTKFCRPGGRATRLHERNMTSREMQYLYKETRLDLDPSSPTSVVQVRVAPLTAVARLGSAIRSSISGKGGVDEFESEWQGKHLASASSVFTRKHHGTPRTILWRVLDNGSVLSLQAADVCKNQKDSDAPLILHLQFPAPIRPTCVDFADPEDHDALYIFAIDQSNQLHSMVLRPDAFRKRSVVEGGLGDFCKSYGPPGFGFKHPQRLVAAGPSRLIVTMHDGGILRFDRNTAQEGTASPILVWGLR